MAKLLTKLFYLALIVAIFSVGVVVFTPFDQNRAYGYKLVRESDDSDKLGWVHERIRQPIDYAFIGSSHTLRGVDDALIEKSVSTVNLGKPLTVANLGRNWFGRNLDYLIVKELLERQKPRVIFLEVPDRVPVGGHVFFPVLASSEELFSASSLENVKFLPDLQTAFKSRVDALVSTSFGADTSGRPAYPYSDHGFLPTEGSFDGRTAAAVLSTLTGPVERHVPSLYHLLQKYNAEYDLAYTRKILELAQEHQVRVSFVFIPIFGTHELPEGYRALTWHYQFLFPPATIFRSAENFADVGHLNPRGAHQLSSWLAGRIMEDVKAHE